MPSLLLHQLPQKTVFSRLLLAKLPLASLGVEVPAESAAVSSLCRVSLARTPSFPVYSHADAFCPFVAWLFGSSVRYIEFSFLFYLYLNVIPLKELVGAWQTTGKCCLD